MLRSKPRLSVRGRKLHERLLRKLPESLQSRPLTWSDRDSRWSASKLWQPSRPESNKPSSRSPEDSLRERKPNDRQPPGPPWNKLSVSHRSSSLASRTSSARPPMPVNIRINRRSRLCSMTDLTHSMTRAAIRSAVRQVRFPLLLTSSPKRAHSVTTICSAQIVHSVVAPSSPQKRSRPHSKRSPLDLALNCQTSSVDYSSQRSRRRSGRWSRWSTSRLVALLQSSLTLTLSMIWLSRAWIRTRCKKCVSLNQSLTAMAIRLEKKLSVRPRTHQHKTVNLCQSLTTRQVMSLT